MKAIQAVGAIATAVIGIAAPPIPPTIKVPVVIDPFESKDEWESLPSNDNWQYKVTFDSPKDSPQDKDAVAINTFFEKYRNEGWFNSTSVFPVSSCRNISLKIRPELKYDASLDNLQNEGETDTNYNTRLEKEIEKNVKPMRTKTMKDNPRGKDETEGKYNERIEAMTLRSYEPDRTRTFPLQIADPRFVRTIRMPDKGSISTHSICGGDTKTEATQIVGYQDLLGELGKQAKAVYDVQKAKAKDKAK